MRLKTNRCSILQGYQFDYVQAIADELGIDDTSQAVSVIILDHIRHIGLEDVLKGDELKNSVTSAGAEENLLEGFLPVSD